jgi:glycosyltransferase involved in cell wall biosynthesis
VVDRSLVSDASMTCIFSSNNYLKAFLDFETEKELAQTFKGIFFFSYIYSAQDDFESLFYTFLSCLVPHRSDLPWMSFALKGKWRHFLEVRTLYMNADWMTQDFSFFKGMPRVAIQLCRILHFYIFQKRIYDDLPRFGNEADVEKHLSKLMAGMRE